MITIVIIIITFFLTKKTSKTSKVTCNSPIAGIVYFNNKIILNPLIFNFTEESVIHVAFATSYSASIAQRVKKHHVLQINATLYEVFI